MVTDLKSFLEEVNPNHFSARREMLENMSRDLTRLGFFLIPINAKDLECYQVRVESVEGTDIILYAEMIIELRKDKGDLLEKIKRVARHETR